MKNILKKQVIIEDIKDDKPSIFMTDREIIIRKNKTYAIANSLLNDNKKKSRRR